MGLADLRNNVRKRFWQPKLNQRADLWTNMSVKELCFDFVQDLLKYIFILFW